MQSVVSPNQMRELETRYIRETGIEEAELMHRAAEALIDVIDERLSGCDGRVAAFACGKGNNGGDGRLCAALFESRGGKSHIIEKAEQLQGLQRPELWVDALFGIGLSRPVEGGNARIIERMNADRALGSMLISVDIPSGLDGNTGRSLGSYVQADITVSFQHRKLGQLLLDGMETCGELVVKPIGMPDALLKGDEARLVELPDLQRMLKPRKRNTNKGSYGHLLILAGSRCMPGAGMLCTMAALRSGCGLVTIACPKSIMPLIQVKAPCALSLPLPETVGGAISKEALPILEAYLEKISAVAIGPGLSGDASPEIVEAVLKCRLPSVIDADALNLIARHPELKRWLNKRHLITPHPGEAARLLNRKMDASAEDAMELRKLGPVALLKGATTVVVGERTHLCISGSSGMAKGGSGDVLTGILGALLAQGYAVEEAAILGSELNGRAGDIAASHMGVYSMTAEDTIGRLGEAFRFVY